MSSSVREIAVRMATTLMGGRATRGRTPRSHAGSSSRDEHYVADLSHELRGPLTVLDLRLQLLDILHSESPEFDAELAEIRAEVRSMVAVVDDVLGISPLTQAGDIAYRSAYSVAAEVIDSLAVLSAASRVELDVRGDRTAISRMGTMSLRRCVRALVENAVKYTPAGGRVSVRVALQKRAVLVDVVDNGIGVDPAVLARIFERNIGSPSPLGAQPSFGIGLALVRQTARRSGGSVSVLDTGSAGTTIRLSVPRARTAVSWLTGT